MNLLDVFGFRVKTKDEETVKSVVPPVNDGSVVIDTAAVTGGWQSYAYDPDAVIKTENEQIRKYREIAAYAEVESAISDIVDEAIVSDQIDYPVKLNLDKLKIGEPLKKKFNECFEEVLELLDFNNDGHEVFRSWYVDGRIYYHILFRENEVANGIAEVRKVDPLKIKKIKQIKRGRNNRGIEVVESTEEYYVYNDRGISENSVQGVKLSSDSVVMVSSGLFDSTTNMVNGFLHKAIKPVNQLRMLEDAVVIYTMTRAPDRRVFYIDVGNMPKIKAEQYVTDIMNKFKNKLVYNAATGEIADSKKTLSMMEDFYMARRDGGKSTEITTLQGSQSLIQADFISYFQDKLYSSLNVPKGRFKQETGFTIGRSQEISREEIKFGKFVSRLRMKFSGLFEHLLRIQLIAKKLIRADEWDDIRMKIHYDFQRDNHFTELKDSEILNNRLASLQLVDPYLGKYYSKAWIQKNVLMMDDQEIKEIESEMAKEVPAVPEDSQEDQPDQAPEDSQEEQPDNTYPGK